jgi:pimeloyl-ACP methyl ester carboxylesterase
VRHLVPSLPLITSETALASSEVRQFIARAPPELDLDRPDVRHEFRRHMRLPTSSLAQLWRLAISSGAAARRVQAPMLVLQGLADGVIRPRDTRLLATRLGGAVELHELAAGHLLLDPTSPTIWDLRRMGVASGPVRSDHSLNFVKLTQPWLRMAAKHFIRHVLVTWVIRRR